MHPALCRTHTACAADATSEQRAREGVSRDLKRLYRTDTASSASWCDGLGVGVRAASIACPEVAVVRKLAQPLRGCWVVWRVHVHVVLFIHLPVGCRLVLMAMPVGR